MTDTPQHYVLRRAGDVDVAFDGFLLANETSEAPGRDFWSEVRIYRTTTGKYVAEQIGISAKGDPQRGGAVVVEKPSDLKTALQRENRRTHQPYITDLAFDALVAASEADPAIAEGLVEQA